MSNLVLAIQAVKQAKEQFEDFQRQYPATRGAKLCELYAHKLNWIGKDLITNPLFGDDIVKGVKQEWESDAYSVPAIYEKFSLLDPNKRELIETIVDGLLAGEEIVFS